VRRHAGESYLRWKIADLAGNVATVLLFSDACKTHWKVQEGDIVVLNRPNLLRSNEVRGLRIGHHSLLSSD